MAKGSHVTYDGYPNVCAGCGKRTKIKHESLWFETKGGVKSTWHFECRWQGTYRSQP